MWITGTILLFGIILLNAIAYMHAYRMTHFVSDGKKTPVPESLTTFQKIRVLVTGVRVLRPSGEQVPGDMGMTHEPVALTTEDQVKLSGWFIPNKEAKGIVVIFHGYASAKAYLLPEARCFHDLGWSVFMIDFRGSGESDGSTTTLGAYESNDVAAATAWAREKAGTSPVVLFGTSMGAVAVMKAIHDDGISADGVIMECPFDTLLNTVKHRFEAIGVPSFPGAQLLVFWGGIQLDFNGFKHNGVNYARSVKCPSLLLHGGNDPRVRTEEVQAIEKNLGGPAKLHVFSDPGHESYCQASAAEYKSVVSAWLESRQIPTQ